MERLIESLSFLDETQKKVLSEIISDEIRKIGDDSLEKKIIEIIANAANRVRQIELGVDALTR